MHLNLPSKQLIIDPGQLLDEIFLTDGNTLA